MALVVEDGTGLADADAYVSADNFFAYLTKYGLSIPSLDSDAVDAAIRRGTQFIDGRYGTRWRGRSLKGRGQALDWPRAHATDVHGCKLPDDVLPPEVVKATIEASAREANSPFSLSPDFVPAQEKIIEEKVGPLITRYSDKGPLDPRPVITIIDEILAPLIGAGNVRQLLRY